MLSREGVNQHRLFLLWGNIEFHKVTTVRDSRCELRPPDREAEFPCSWRRSSLLEDIFLPYQTFPRTYSHLHTLSLYTIYDLTVSATWWAWAWISKHSTTSSVLKTTFLRTGCTDFRHGGSTNWFRILREQLWSKRSVGGCLCNEGVQKFHERDSTADNESWSGILRPIRYLRQSWQNLALGTHDHTRISYLHRSAVSIEYRLRQHC